MKSFISFCIFLFLPADGLSPVFAQPTVYTRVFYDLNGSAQVYGQLKTPGGDYLLTGHKDNKPFVRLNSRHTLCCFLPFSYYWIK